MQSPAGSHNPQVRSALSLAALALAALAVSLLLAFASATAPSSRTNGDGHHTKGERRSGAQPPETTAKTTTAQRPIAAPTVQPSADGVGTDHRTDVVDAAGNGRGRPLPLLVDQPLLWTLLAPWTFAVDALAVLGLAAVLIVGYNTRRRKGR